MANTKPLVAAALICERVLREEGGVLTAIRIVDTFKRQTVPIATPLKADGTSDATDATFNAAQVLDMTALVILKAGSLSGQHEVAIVIRNPEGRETHYPTKFPVNFRLNDPAEGAQLIARIVMPGNTPAGLYWIDVLWDGEKLTSIPLKLETESTPQATA